MPELRERDPRGPPAKPLQGDAERADPRRVGRDLADLLARAKAVRKWGAPRRRPPPARRPEAVEERGFPKDRCMNCSNP